MEVFQCQTGSFWNARECSRSAPSGPPIQSRASITGRWQRTTGRYQSSRRPCGSPRRRTERNRRVSLFRPIDSHSQSSMHQSAFELCIPTKAAKVPDRPEWITRSSTTATALSSSATARYLPNFRKQARARGSDIKLPMICAPRTRLSSGRPSGPISAMHSGICG